MAQVRLIDDAGAVRGHGYAGSIDHNAGVGALSRYPDEPDVDMYWVKFDDDTQPIRQVKGSWIVKANDF